MTLPPPDVNNCLKGVRREDAQLSDTVNFSVFVPEREEVIDGQWHGSSVNWDLADGGALQELLERRKNGELQFKVGAVRIPRAALDKIQSRVGPDNFGYELREEAGNPYHGHLLFSSSLKKEDRTTICGFLCYAAILEGQQQGDSEEGPP